MTKTTTTATTAERATCQICFRQQALTADRRMVLHGYERPGHGYAVGSCPGVGHAPLELEKAALESYIDRLQDMEDGALQRMFHLDNGTWTTITLVNRKRVAGTFQYVDERVQWQRGTPLPAFVPSYRTERDVVASERAQADSLRRQLRADIDEREARLVGWAPRPEAIVPAAEYERQIEADKAAKAAAKAAKAAARAIAAAQKAYRECYNDRRAILVDVVTGEVVTRTSPRYGYEAGAIDTGWGGRTVRVVYEQMPKPPRSWAK